MNNKLLHTIGFILILLAIYIWADFYHILQLSPRGIHFIRQVDSLSFTENYFLHGYDFFEPHVFNLNSKEGKAACEFPLIYYICAKFYYVFGNEYWVQRLFNLLISTVGFISFFWMCRRVLNDWLLSIVTTILVLSSTVVLYYSSNALVDSSALGFCFIGLNLFFKSSSSNKRMMFLSFAYFSLLLSTLLKVTFGIFPLCIFLIVFSDFVPPYQKEKRPARSILYVNVLLLLLSILAVSSWYSFAIDYNLKNGDNYFLTTISPYWNLSIDNRAHVFEALTNGWRTSFYYPQIFQLIGMGIILSAVFFKRVSNELLLFSVFSLAGITCYLILFFGQFKDHDYYFLPCVPFCAVILLMLMQLIGKLERKWLIGILKLLLIGVCVASLNYSLIKLEGRYVQGIDKYEFPSYDLSAVSSILQRSNIESDSRFLVIGDLSPNGVLYFLRRKGYSFKDEAELNRRIDKEQIIKDCNYLILDNMHNLNSSLDQFQTDHILQVGRWTIYRNRYSKE